MSKIGRYLRLSVISMAFLAVLGVSGVCGMLGVVVWQVIYGDHTELQKSTILAKIKEETTLYYLDESTRIGSIFESRHRRYVPIDEMPAHMINAIVAAEDKNFYEHFGIDPLATGKAAAEGILSGGRFRRGGSTITQQTVKNIIDDWEASFSRKFREMIKALQLERLYDKRQILEFYLNQFHVAGNGNGVGIAARYYFNKDVMDLNLVEAAFIAGSVKGPGKYNPFIKYTKKTREKAKEHAHERKNYVLGRMFEQNWISAEEYDEAINAEIPFNKGEFRTAEVALVELVRTQLEKPEVLEALGIKNPDELNIAGMKVYTTIDSEMQKNAQLAMRKNLSRLETILSGFKPEPPERYKPKRDLKVNRFEYGKVIAVEGSNINDYKIKVSFGLPVGTISNASLVRYAKLLDLAVGKGHKFYLKEIIKQIRPGDILFVQVMDYDKENNEAVLELQKRPKISGGMIALDKGEVRAVVSGFDTLGFNRAMYAKRQPGSLFKAPIYFAALQLGWSMLDRIENVRQIFPYQGQFYYPRPDHKSPYQSTSMMWAGIMSENLASVALGSRLLEKINFEQFKQLLDSLGLMPQQGESSRDYHYRVSREIGVSLDNEGIKAYQLTNAIDDIAPDLIFAGRQSLLSRLKLMWYGTGYLAESVVLRNSDPKEIPEHEIKIRLRLLSNNFQRMKILSAMLRQDWQNIQISIQNHGLERSFNEPRIRTLIDRFRVQSSPSMKPELGYLPLLEEEEEIDIVNEIPIQEVGGRPLNILDVQAIWGGESAYGSMNSAGINLDDVKLAGYLDAQIFRKLEEAVEQRTRTAMAHQDPYLLGRYFQHHDFKIGLGLYYVVKLSEAAGIYSKLEPVLSFPLGSNDVSASEVAKLYQTFISGKTYRFYKDGPDNQISFIRRIEDRSGKVLYQPIAEEHQLVDPVFALQMGEILRKTVTHGTGRRARGELYITMDQEEGSPKPKAKKGEKRVRIPAFGKTGTTNDYMTSYFAGFIPYPTRYGEALDTKNSYVISAYVGYDFNKVMRRGRQRIYGGSGALPMWTDFAKNILETQDYKSSLDPLDLKVIASKEWPLSYNMNLSTPLLIDLPRGLILRTSKRDDFEVWQTTDIASTGETYQDLFALGSSVKSVVYVPTDSQDNAWQPLRLFGPYQPHPKPDQSNLEKNRPTNEVSKVSSASRAELDDSKLPSQDATEFSEAEEVQAARKNDSGGPIFSDEPIEEEDL
ncbi:MAG: transglycosylase domain-containing protein [Oligoflexales bacterium]|nr:transglycosylase domain-containing protein [Oligoflexales bacterium]